MLFCLFCSFYSSIHNPTPPTYYHTHPEKKELSTVRHHLTRLYDLCTNILSHPLLVHPSFVIIYWKFFISLSSRMFRILIYLSLHSSLTLSLVSRIITISPQHQQYLFISSIPRPTHTHNTPVRSLPSPPAHMFMRHDARAHRSFDCYFLPHRFVSPCSVSAMFYIGSFIRIVVYIQHHGHGHSLPSDSTSASVAISLFLSTWRIPFCFH